MRKFLISVDTEGDNLWSWNFNDPITTENAKYIMRFQELCEQYAFIPTYLTNFEMATDKNFVSLFKKKAEQGKCEIGMHLHAWNSPPEYLLKKIYSGNPFITEYPPDIIYEKHDFLKKLLEKNFEQPIRSYRAGRWATSDVLFDILEAIGIIVDCSVTPGISHSKNEGMTVSGGTNYVRAQRKPYRIRENLVEIPMTTCLDRGISGSTVKKKIRHLIRGNQYWLRPIGTGLENLNETRQLAESYGDEYLMFMIHSSELMPGGSPYFKDIQAVENLYKIMDDFFRTVIGKYEGMSIGEYGNTILKRKSD